MSGEPEQDKAESCEREKETAENLHNISCECFESEEVGKVCTCGAVKETTIIMSDKCADPWTSYERGCDTHGGPEAAKKEGKNEGKKPKEGESEQG